MISPEQLTIKAQEALQRAQGLAIENSHQHMEPAHVLITLIRDKEGLVTSILQKLGVNLSALETDLEAALESFVRVEGGTGQIYVSKTLNDDLNQAHGEARKLKDDYIEGEGSFYFYLKRGENEGIRPYRFKTLLWEDEDKTYFLLASMAALEKFWGRPVDLTPKRETLDFFIWDEIVPHVKVFNKS